MNSVKDEFCIYSGLPATELNELILIRETLMRFELFTMKQNLPHFYCNSTSLVLSHLQDEDERDQDTDWTDMQMMVDKIMKGDIDKVLDFGCGIGSAGINLARRVEINELWLYDPNHVARAFMKNRQIPAQAEIVSNPGNIPDDYFNLILCWGVFEHLEDEKANDIFQSLINKLKPATGRMFLKNFYSCEDEYRFHFKLGPMMKRNYTQHAEKIIFARFSD